MASWCWHCTIVAGARRFGRRSPASRRSRGIQVSAGDMRSIAFARCSPAQAHPPQHKRPHVLHGPGSRVCQAASWASATSSSYLTASCPQPAVLQEEVEALGSLGPLLFVATVAGCELIPLFPTQPLSLAAGLLFGPVEVRAGLMPDSSWTALPTSVPSHTALRQLKFLFSSRMPLTINQSSVMQCEACACTMLARAAHTAVACLPDSE